MPAGRTRKARRVALHAPVEPVELTPDDLATLRRLARKVARRMADHRVVDEDDLHQQGAVAVVELRREVGAPSRDLVRAAAVRAMHRLAYGRRLAWQASDAAGVPKAEIEAKRPALRGHEALDVRLAVASLPPDQAEVMGRRAYLSQARAEIMASMGWGRDWVGDRTRAAISALRLSLADYEDEFGRSVPLRNPKRYRLVQRFDGLPRPRKRHAYDPEAGRRRIARKLAVIEAAHARLA